MAEQPVKSTFPTVAAVRERLRQKHEAQAAELQKSVTEVIYKNLEFCGSGSVRISISLGISDYAINLVESRARAAGWDIKLDGNGDYRAFVIQLPRDL